MSLKDRHMPTVISSNYPVSFNSMNTTEVMGSAYPLHISQYFKASAILSQWWPVTQHLSLGVVHTLGSGSSLGTTGQRVAGRWKSTFHQARLCVMQWLAACGKVRKFGRARMLSSSLFLSDTLSALCRELKLKVYAVTPGFISVYNVFM